MINKHTHMNISIHTCTCTYNYYVLYIEPLQRVKKILNVVALIFLHGRNIERQSTFV